MNYLRLFPKGSNFIIFINHIYSYEQQRHPTFRKAIAVRAAIIIRHIATKSSSWFHRACSIESHRDWSIRLQRIFRSDIQLAGNERAYRHIRGH